jgi:hypothetical protein
MIALMAIWFGRLAGLPSDGGYFYLCPACYARTIEPHVGDVVSRLVEQHPFLHRLAAASEAHRVQPARQAGAHPAPLDTPPSTNGNL